MIRTREELRTVVAELPFGTSARDGIKRSVTLLHEAPTAEQRDALLAASHEAETFVVRGRDVYSELDKDALGNGRFTDVERPLGMAATRRTWNVVTALVDLVN